MGRPHTIIGAERFHFRVRDGFGWFPLAIAARQTGGRDGHLYRPLIAFGKSNKLPVNRARVVANHIAIVLEARLGVIWSSLTVN